MKPSQDTLMLGIGSDAILAALSTVVRKPVRKRQPKRPSTASSPSAEHSPVLGTGSEAVQAGESLVTTDFSSVKSTSIPASAASSTYGVWPVLATIDSSDVRTPDAATANESLPIMQLSKGNSLFDKSLSSEDSPGLDINTKDAIATVSRKQPAATISPSARPVEMSNLVDLTESSPIFIAKPSSIPVTKRQETVHNRRGNKPANMTKIDDYSVQQAVLRVDKNGEEDRCKAKWPVSRAVVEVSHIQTEMTRGLKTTVVDYWLNTCSDTRGETELIKYVKEAEKTIKMGVDILNREEMIKELSAAVDRGVVVQLFIDFKKACDEGLEWVKRFLEAGVNVCHSTEKFEWKAAIFDGQILVQSWTTNDPLDFNLAYAMVHTGPIVCAFECQFDKLWKAATKKVKQDGKRARTESSDSEDELKPGRKRKRRCFPTTLPFLEMLGL